MPPLFMTTWWLWQTPVMGLNLSMQASAEVVGALSLGYRDFNALNEETQRSIAETAGRFKQLGVDAASSAQALDLLDNSLGMTRSTAHAAMKDFERLSMETGQPLSALTKDFITLAPELSRFGEAGKKVFEDLAKQARQLGLGVKQAFDFTDMFDTFQGAADIAGKLNAQLGMQLNSTEMMGASSEERLKILRAEFDMQGLNFKEMTRREKQMVAAMMNTDVGTAGRLFGDPMELRRMQRDQEEQEARLARFTTAVEKLQEAFEQMFVKIEPILTQMTRAIGGLAEVFGWAISAGQVMLAIAAKIAWGFSGVQTAALNAGKGLAVLSRGMVAIGGVVGVFVGLIDALATGDWVYGLVSGLGAIFPWVVGRCCPRKCHDGTWTRHHHRRCHWLDDRRRHRQGTVRRAGG